MANILILGGGLGGVTAAEAVAKDLAAEHQITLISRSPRFTVRPNLLGFVFGKHPVADVSYNLPARLHKHGIRFIKGEIARVDPYDRRVTIAHGDIHGSIHYDCLIFALGGRLATERVPGFFEHAHHSLTLEAALKFRSAIRGFSEGRAIIGRSVDAESTHLVHESAIALSRHLEDRGERERAQITIVTPGGLEAEFTDLPDGDKVQHALAAHRIRCVPEFPVHRITSKSVLTGSGNDLDYDLLMLLPPFQGPSSVRGMGITDDGGFIRIDKNMRVKGVERMYAVGGSVNVPGSRNVHLVKAQAELAASNLLTELKGAGTKTRYEHDLTSDFAEEVGSFDLYARRLGPRQSYVTNSV